MIIGNYMLLNLFLAILLKFISENDEGDEPADSTKIETPRSGSPPVKAIGAPVESRRIDGQNDSKGPGQGLEDSGPLNSSNSNIEEEFE
jgi:hypothetical protein